MTSFWKRLSGYTIDAFCENCGHKTILRIPRGIFVYDFLKDNKCICSNCGCRIMKLVGNEDLDPNSLEKEHKSDLMSLREKLKQKREKNN